MKGGVVQAPDPQPRNKAPRLTAIGGRSGPPPQGWALGFGALALMVMAGGLTYGLRSSGPFKELSAPGRLELAGETRKLAGPVTAAGNSPRLIQLLVKEGEFVERGQLLAQFDTGPALQAERRLLQSRYASLSRQAGSLEAEVDRYRPLVQAGALARADLLEREQQLVELQAGVSETRQAITRTDADLGNSELRAPVAGKVMRLYARVGERPGVMGILELSTSDRLEAVAEVADSDLARIHLGQAARINSLSGAFPGTLSARVSRVSPADGARGDGVVEVRLDLAPADARRVRKLAGLRTITHFAS
ncbi:HlyD family efflux transporter periplasmic adaptor subunit [Synechococcus sp. CCFWC 502]|uniref:HlyD family efflux transporter periplasmic adaptor subunit n=1 Tax=unclassified Synechococcus TaxID=2626047 RepID=UPI0006805C76|nr:HlyD family efflux transporter periplasmic adaptor subunit [Synechococcus sp. CCFWC 502]WFN59379.1 HlyD family efflux transporter periplasmic adaptor subunit [Synechococcus sp. CCFWC 502]